MWVRIRNRSGRRNMSYKGLDSPARAICTLERLRFWQLSVHQAPNFSCSDVMLRAWRLPRDALVLHLHWKTEEARV